MTLTLILLGIGNVVLLLAVRSLRQQRLKERYALLFGAVGIPFLALAVWPNAVGYLAAHLGIEYHTVLLLAVTAFFLLMNFNLLSIVSVQERRINCLSQIVAMLSQTQKGAATASGQSPAAPLPLDKTDAADKEVA